MIVGFFEQSVFRVMYNESVLKSRRSVSAVMALYNPEPEYLKKAIASVLCQTTSVHELVLVNDGGDVAVIESVLPDDDRIRLYSKPNGGVADARNFGIERCSGDFVAFLDQDDYWYPDKIESQLSRVSSAAGRPCMVVSPADIVDMDGTLDRKNTARTSRIYRIKSSQKSPLRGLLTDNFIYSSTIFIDRRIFGLAGGFDPSVQPHDDWDMYLRIAIGGYPIFFADRPLSVWRTHGGNESGNTASMQRSMCRVYRKNLPTIQQESSKKLLKFFGLLTAMNRAGDLVYKRRRYALYRKHIGRMLAMVPRYFPSPEGADSNLFFWELREIAETLTKSMRRYLISSIRKSIR
jgi:glycosyltransferase involved in cell wall biosynthesis